MIYSIRCDKPSFKTITFRDGLNVILAERTKDSSKKDSRNGLGKTTVIEIINFCMGGKKGETLKKNQLDDWTFTIEMDIKAKKYLISRNTKKANEIFIEGDCSKWPIKPDKDKENQKQVLSRKDWTKSLGVLFFDLQLIDEENKYSPKFRSLIAYFVRKSGEAGAYLTAFKNYSSQKEFDVQISNSFLLNLGWDYASKFQVLKDRENVINQIKAEAQAGFISHVIGSIGELETKKIRLQAQIDASRISLGNFKVHPQYKQLETDANTMTKAIHELINQNIMDKKLLENYEQSLLEEVDTKQDQVSKLYEEAGLHFSEAINKRLDDVLAFHKKVLVNRKDFLKNETDRLKLSITERDVKIEKITEDRAVILLTLQTHKALEEYTQLQAHNQTLISELKDISLRIDNLKKFEQGKSSIVVEKQLLQQNGNKDLDERKKQKENAVLTFNSYTNSLYQVPGNLSIDLNETGYKFNISIERSGSYGINNMKIFCYDLMLSKLWAKKKIPLVHDSIIFADVDERQKALAIQLAQSESEKNGIQYILTLNSDAIPAKDFDKDFNFDKYVRLTLTDATDNGGLLGIRF